jgi:hypothetical protein
MSTRPVERRWELGDFTRRQEGEPPAGAAALWTAQTLDRELWTLVHGEARAERELARGLAVLWDREHYRPLGHARAIDFVREELGIEEGTARRLARLGRVLTETPLLDQAFVAGRLSAAHVLELKAVVTAETGEEESAGWIALAERLSFRSLQQIIRKTKEERGEQTSDDGATETPPAGIDPAPDGGWMVIPAPAQVGLLWQEALAVARATAGQHLRAGQAAELVFAEYLSGTGGDDEATPEDELDAAHARLLAQVQAALNAQSAPKKRKRKRTAAPADDTAKTARFARVPWTVPLDVLPADCRVDPAADPWTLGTTLKRVVAYQNGLRSEIAGRLARLHAALLWARLGFTTFNAYCEDRLALGLLQAERLIRFHHGLCRCKVLRKAYRRGRLSYTAVLLLLPLLHASTAVRWVRWARGRTFREIERVTELARLFALPGADPTVLATWCDGLVATGFARRSAHDPSAFAAGDGAATGAGAADGAATGLDHDPSAFAAAGVPLGYPLPPSSLRGAPRIVGFPHDLALLPAERTVATIRFFLPAATLDLAATALHRCRRAHADPLRPTWVYLELILRHFLATHSAPDIRAYHRRVHPVLARDGFRCTAPGCTGCAQLEDHHLTFKSRGGSDHLQNRTTLCAAHHRHGIHRGSVQLGGDAPDHLIARLGIHPATGHAFAAFINERRVSDHHARLALAAWRRRQRRVKG